MTADDVVASINRVLDPNLKPNPSPVASGLLRQHRGRDRRPRGKAKTASGIKVVDPTTVEFTWSMPTRPSSTSSRRRSPRSSRRSWPATDAEAFSAKPVGHRAIPVQEYTKGQGATFVKNPTYWQPGQPYLDQIDYKTGQDDNAMLQQIEAGTLDMMGDPLPPAQFTDVTTNPEYKDQIYHHTLVNTDYVFMDTQQPNNGPFSNVKVRQAVNYAIDKDAILQISHGAGVPAELHLPAGPGRL